MSVLKPEISGIHSEKHKTQKPLEDQKNTKYRNIS